MRKETLGELIANAVSHGIGMILAIVALVVLLIRADGPTEVTGVVVFAMSMFMLYTSSTLFHAFPRSMKRVMAVFQRLDHSAIYLLIAGTYTPFVLLLSPQRSGIILLVILWVIAVTGIVFKSIWIRRYQGIHLLMYLLMGWSAVFIWRDVASAITQEAFVLLLVGGLSYTLGVIFYISRFRYAHFVWHVFVLGGSFFHFLTISVLL
ncbi:MAG: hypothetical protein EA374_05300 [Acholeplasmatales bacterium]|nr:MAG: hypothetical protein EA374_05300 [Acholeplasmatales bacterium]